VDEQVNLVTNDDDDDDKPSRSVVVMMQVLNWAYDRATGTIPGWGSVADFAERHRKSRGGSTEKAIDDLIAWQVGYAGAIGFVSNLGGLITMPAAVPANLASVILIQLRMVAAIAYLRGYKVDDERVRTMAFICLTGSSAATTILEKFGIPLGAKLATGMIMQIPRAILLKINQAVGFRLVTKAGTTGIVNLTKFVPIVVVSSGGTFDAAVTRGIGGRLEEGIQACRW
jgi:hypothetical protein